MTRSRRYSYIVGLLALAVLLGVGWAAFRTWFPNAFDRETENADEVAKLAAANLSQAAERAETPEAMKAWPQFGGTTRGGWASDAALNTDWTAKPPKKLWETPCGGGYSSMAVANGRVYTQDKQGSDERVFALDATTGKVAWEHRTPTDYSGFKAGYAGGPRATPTVDGNRVYALGGTGLLRCVAEPAGGGTVQVLWQIDLMKEFRAPLPQWGFASSPLIEGDLVIVQAGGKDGSVVAFDKATGGQRWAAGKEPNGYSSPVVATLGGVRQILAVTGESLVGIRPTDGEVLWRQPWVTQHNGNVAMPVVVGDYVFVSSSYSKGCALFHVTPEGKGGAAARVVYFRPNKVMRAHHNTCVHLNGYLYGFDGNDLRCVDLKAGTVVEDWPSPDAAGRLAKGTLILAGKHLIGLTQTGTLFLAKADPTDFQFLGRMEKVLSGSECWALPALADGKLFLRDAEKVVCLDLAN